MSVEVAPTKPVRGERWPECPITGLRFPESEGVWCRGMLVHPKSADAPGYMEPANDEPGEVAEYSSDGSGIDVDLY